MNMICWSRDEESVGGVGMKLEVTSDSHGGGLWPWMDQRLSGGSQ